MKSALALLTVLVYLSLFGSAGYAHESAACFLRPSTIESLPGSNLLPEEICIDQLSLSGSQDAPILHIEGKPVKGEYELDFLSESGDLTKWMAYPLRFPIESEGREMEVTARISVDITKESREIDWYYLAAEFFTYYDDGGYEVHIYYWPRRR